MSNYVRNFDVKNYYNRTTIPQLIANNMSGCFFLKHGVYLKKTKLCFFNQDDTAFLAFRALSLPVVCWWLRKSWFVAEEMSVRPRDGQSDYRCSKHGHLVRARTRCPWLKVTIISSHNHVQSSTWWSSPLPC